MGPRWTLTTLPTDVLEYLVDISPIWTSWRLSSVNKGLRALALPKIWRYQSIDIAKASFLVDHPILADFIQTASLLPSPFFGTDEEPPSEQHLYILTQLLTGLTRLKDLTLPLPDHGPTFELLAIKSLTSLRLTHAQPTPDLLRRLSETCPGLLRLEFSLYSFQHALWILTHDALESYAEAIAGFRNLQYIDLCASVHFLRDAPTIGNPIIFEDAQPDPTDINEDFLTPEVATKNQRTASLILARSQSCLQYIIWSAPIRLYISSPDLQGIAKSVLQVWVWRVERNSEDEDTHYSREYTARIKRDNNLIDAECEGGRHRATSWDETYRPLGVYGNGGR